MRECERGQASAEYVGVLALAALVFVTVLTSFRYVFVRVPWQPAYLAVFAAFLGVMLVQFRWPI